MVRGMAADGVARAVNLAKTPDENALALLELQCLLMVGVHPRITNMVDVICPKG